ncbi:glycoside hydrolase family 3 N-terminal domain-containing protein [Microbacterium sp. PRC9]|uniref:glycoside hydrolase family 3 N-terminal domain-containing protein n=1 Tax=Microbacterium sp. PRC9 TaxID=2962591 RepID=UPI002882063C|nr:glycoside hydrolase family 3 N-terminal domain-containing protein [Microbacterium sp. PRC9]MDT0144562.1 glycoside hydrolase family 3 N-terminal domain-containing protein [Microbacterium sp. PRC9]
MTEPFRRADLPVEGRVADLLSRLTLEEKVGQLTQFFHLGIEVPEGLDLETLPPEQRAYAEQPKIVEAAIRGGGTGSVLFVKDPATANRMQRLAVEESRLGIPLIFGFDVIHGIRTIFPVPLALAATWSTQIVEAAQSAAAREARAVGIHWTFAPMVDIARDARWGRIIEGAGEDPVLGAAVAAAQVRGFQGELGRDSILAGPKHFVGYGANRGGRDYDDVEVSESELWNVYLPPFQAAIDAGAVNVMSAYMDYNGVPASGNRRLLTDVLRGELGFDGFVVSDNNAVRSLETQHFAKDLTDAAVRAVSAGVDMEMCMFDPAFSRLAQAVRDGLVDEAVIDAAVRRVLTAKFRLGLFEAPYAEERAAAEVLSSSSSRDQAQAAAEASFVLLKNEDAALPLSAASLTSIAVIGQLADSKRDTLGPWVFDHDTDETVTILDGLRSRLGDTAKIDFAPGAGIPRRMFPSMFDQMDATVVATPEDYDDAAETRSAVEIAAAADVAIVVVGQRQNQIGENASTSTLTLPGAQEEQLRQIVETGTPVVLIVMSGRPLDLRWADANVPAILQVWYPGTRGGDAVASVLLGDASPAGRLPFTWPRHVGQLPMVYAHNRTFAPQDQGARYWEEESTPLYPFGHGLSYAAFGYSNLTLDRDRIDVGESVAVSVDVTNTSPRQADEVVQLYIHQRYGTSSRPVRELKAFERVTIAAGETRTVRLALGPDQLRYWSAVTGGFVQDATTLDIWVGSSSTADLATVLEVTDSASARHAGGGPR